MGICIFRTPHLKIIPLDQNWGSSFFWFILHEFFATDLIQRDNTQKEGAKNRLQPKKPELLNGVSSFFFYDMNHQLSPTHASLE